MRFFLPTVILAAVGLLLIPEIPSATAQEPEDLVAEEVLEGHDLEAELKDAQQQLGVSHLRMAALLADHNLGMLSAQADVDATRVALQMFVDFDAELETATIQLDLDQTKDRLADSIEELDQLAIMYDQNALASVTAQVVLDRAARSIERQRVSVAIQDKTVAAWNAYGLANRQKELGHAALLAQASLESTISNQELEIVEMEMEIAELEQAIKELQAEIADDEVESED